MRGRGVGLAVGLTVGTPCFAVGRIVGVLVGTAVGEPGRIVGGDVGLGEGPRYWLTPLPDTVNVA